MLRARVRYFFNCGLRYAASNIRRYNFGTTEAREGRAFLAAKRHRMKHLDFDLLLVRDQGVGLQILSPRPILSTVYDPVLARDCVGPVDHATWGTHSN